MNHENQADQSALLQAACTKSKCIELLALAADYREALPQVLELLRQYYAAEKVCFYECGEPDTDGRQEAGSFSAPVIFEENLYGKLQEYLLRLSYQDQLTGIQNNTSYIRMLNQLLEHPVPVGVAFADLNGLKYLNDTYGHEYGDQALRHLAEVSMEYFAKDQLYRISGDEFVIICPKVQEEVFIRQAQLLKERLKQEEQGLAAFGYLWNDGTTAADRLLHGAERLMYQEKQQHYRDSTRRVQECPGYAQALYKRYRQQGKSGIK